jgi:catechol 2,3-dioxygenase-like lactoylglutathione lyase family enzyme
MDENPRTTNAPADASALLIHLRHGALRWVRSSHHYEETVAFYRDLVGLPVVDSFASSYGEDGTIFGLPDYDVHMEVVRAHGTGSRPDRFDQLVFYLPDHGAVAAATSALRDHGERPADTAHPYWVANGALVFLDPDGRGVVYAPWVYGRAPDPASRGSISDTAADADAT